MFQFQNAEKFRLNGLVNYTKEQFLNLKLKIGVFNSISVTEEVINQFIKNWIDGTGFRFQQLHIGFWGYRKLDEILEGIDFREWDQDFVNEVSIKNVSFVTDFESVCGPGKLFQIPSKMDHFESITVQVSDVNTIFLNLYHTGTRATSSDGEIYANYTAPEQLESGF
ncbi:hypothetical protein B9Z55_013086 [Caenorhabditis nigoni]|uniref:Sdz-33 F-box domain-containing protein n=1 Tax=Caenorhabditis nigoni TaxID=1611254 RepID=A0A2G5U063_9PELO|nr:hypothetical protein B9Z55_013086 [Caenorhabditis nigoni]